MVATERIPFVTTSFEGVTDSRHPGPGARGGPEMQKAFALFVRRPFSTFRAEWRAPLDRGRRDLYFEPDRRRFRRGRGDRLLGRGGATRRVDHCCAGLSGFLWVSARRSQGKERSRPGERSKPIHRLLGSCFPLSNSRVTAPRPPYVISLSRTASPTRTTAPSDELAPCGKLWRRQ